MALHKLVRWLTVFVTFALVTTACASGASVASSEAGPPTTATETTTTTSGTATTPTSTRTTTAEVVPVEGSGASNDAFVLVSANEVEAALRGNTIVGNWVGEDYRQFFDESGITTYRPVESGREDVGQWRVNAETDLYESLWGAQITWDAYEVHRNGDTWFWTGGGVQLSPFTIVEGNQLTG